MQKKFRFYDPFNDYYFYSDTYDSLATFFSDYQLALGGDNNPILEQFTGLHDSTTWKELSEEKREEWLSKDFAPSLWNGIPVYENDILDFDEKAWRGKFNPEAVPNLSEFVKEWPMCGISADVHVFRKVVGNKNQHPELLKKEK